MHLVGPGRPAQKRPATLAPDPGDRHSRFSFPCWFKAQRRLEARCSISITILSLSSPHVLDVKGNGKNRGTKGHFLYGEYAAHTWHAAGGRALMHTLTHIRTAERAHIGHVEDRGVGGNAQP